MNRAGLRWATVLSVLAGSIAFGPPLSWARQQPPLVRTQPYSKDELGEIKKLEQFEKLYRWGSEVFRAVAEQLIERTYLNEKAKIRKDFRTSIVESRKSTEVRRLEAIKEFEAKKNEYEIKGGDVPSCHDQPLACLARERGSYDYDRQIFIYRR